MVMKKVILAISVALIATLSSCGGTESTDTEHVEEVGTEVYEETLKAQDEVDDINSELEELDAVDKEIEDLGNELDNI